MNLDIITAKFIDQVIKRKTYASREELINCVHDMQKIISENKDKTPQEMISILIAKDVALLETIKEEYKYPGYSIGVSTGNIDVRLMGGDLGGSNRIKMDDNALFDIASMTKFYTQIIIYNLISENVFNFNTKVRDLDDSFIDLGDLTVGDITSFETTFKTNGRISDFKTIDEAQNCLHTTQVVETGKYNYNDIGMMIMKEVVEKVTKRSFQELLQDYVLDPADLKETYLIVPEPKKIFTTGSANAEFGEVNDPKSVALGGFSGHAGIFTTTADLLKFGNKLFDDSLIPRDLLKDAYQSGSKDIRGKMGNTYVSHPLGLDKTYVDKTESLDSFAIQGSTRTQSNFGENKVYTIFLNPASMSIEQAKEIEKRINYENSLKEEPGREVRIVEEFNFIRDNKDIQRKMIDARYLAPIGKTTDLIDKSVSALALNLEFLNFYIKAYEHNFNEEIRVTHTM
ncbi:MAG: serine hydrolase domain-containing protein [Bacilli bacterium]